MPLYKHKKLWWLLWILFSFGLSGYYANALVGANKHRFLPGKTSSGHYQIEQQCNVCHSPFGGDQALQQACVKCHGKELKAVEDSHPKSKFTDPRNADRVAVLDARLCITCHQEHRPDLTHAMGVTLPTDFCYYCHSKIAKDRPSHKGMAFDTCSSAGCHNFHDNKALYEDFLVKHMNEPVVLPSPHVVQRNLADFLLKTTNKPVHPLAETDMDAPDGVRKDSEFIKQWASSAHARGGINCTGCHQVKIAGVPSAWQDKPVLKVCRSCHNDEAEGFLQGKHGMRLAQNLSPMRPEMARHKMKSDTLHASLGCVSCHGAHAFDTRRAAVETCLNCHDDEHSKAYKQSKHFQLWQQEVSGQAKAGTGVSCATCHLPREVHRQQGLDQVIVQHDQNLNLRPNEKMIRGVCMQCHGLGFSIDALADTGLIQNNFKGRPSTHIKSIDMAKRRIKTKSTHTSGGNSNEHLTSAEPRKPQY